MRPSAPTGHRSPRPARTGRSSSGTRRTGQLVHTFTGHTAIVTSAAFSPDGSRARLDPAWTGQWWFGMSRRGRAIHTLEGHPGIDGPRRGVQPRRDPTRLRRQARTVKVWDVATGRELANLPGRVRASHLVLWPSARTGRGSPSGGMTAPWRSGMRRTYKLVRTLNAASTCRTAFRVAFSPDGTRLASAEI